MTSPIRQNLFERECDMPLLEARHLALLLLGLDASQPANALPEEHQENYRILHDAISRTIKATGMVSAPANKRMFYADEMFALAWRLIDDELTPPEIKARSLKAVMKLSRNSRGRKWLKTLGDDALPDLTASPQPSLRGMHKRDKARENTARLCWLLVQLLVDETDGRYGTSDKPASDRILRKLKELAQERELPSDGLGRGTFYEVLKMGREKEV
ncbi:TPA: hypothetical protein ACG62V_002811 [Escherichia coli]